MPNRDGKGPDNQGPKTGRGLGPCKDDGTNGGQRPGRQNGKGRRPRRGDGRGRGQQGR